MSVWFSRIFLVGLLAVSDVAYAASLSEAIALTPQAGDAAEDVAIRHWQTKAAAATTRAEYFERLAWAYIGKARRSSDVGYYKLAEETVKAMDARFGSSAESRLIQGHVLHNLHRFHEAEIIARDLVQSRGDPLELALLSDVLMEQGKIDEAVVALQQFANLKPGAEAFSRIAHVRWIKGDLAGAIGAMEQAVGASTAAEPAVYAWLLSRLSGYCLQQGDATRAAKLATTALATAPDFAPALLALGKANLALDQRSEALIALRRAAALNPLPEYQWWLADALQSSGKSADSAACVAQLTAQGPRSDPRTTALFLATRMAELPQALQLAAAELKTRQDIFTRDAHAWALSAVGENELAQRESDRALSEHTKDARLFLHAGVIAQRAGSIEHAHTFLTEAAAQQFTLTPGERALLAHSLESLSASPISSTAIPRSS